MEILGIGPLELMLILLIALIVLGPNDMVKAGHTLGVWLRKLVTSPYWNIIQQTSKDFRYLPNKLMREAGLEEEMKSLNDVKSNMQNIGSTLQGDLLKLNQDVQKDIKDTQTGMSAWISPPAVPSAPAPVTDSTSPVETIPSPDPPVVEPATPSVVEETKPVQTPVDKTVES